MKRTLLVPLIVGAAALVPSSAGAATVHGVVVGRQHGLLLVATPSGLVQAVRASAPIGARLAGTRIVGRASRVRLHGVVVERVGTTMFLSSNHHLLAVRLGRLPAAVTPSVGPQPGSVVDTTVGVKENGDLDEQNETEVGHVTGTVQVQATVTAVGAGTVTLAVDGRTLTVDLPAGLTLPAAVVGQTVSLDVSVGNEDDQGDDEQGGDGSDG